jgi:hypothetical protein
MNNYEKNKLQQILMFVYHYPAPHHDSESQADQELNGGNLCDESNQENHQKFKISRKSFPVLTSLLHLGN